VSTSAVPRLDNECPGFTEVDVGDGPNAHRISEARHCPIGQRASQCASDAIEGSFAHQAPPETIYRARAVNSAGIRSPSTISTASRLVLKLPSGFSPTIS